MAVVCLALPHQATLSVRPIQTPASLTHSLRVTLYSLALLRRLFIHAQQRLNYTPAAPWFAAGRLASPPCPVRGHDGVMVVVDFFFSSPPSSPVPSLPLLFLSSCPPSPSSSCATHSLSLSVLFSGCWVSDRLAGCPTDCLSALALFIVVVVVRLGHSPFSHHRSLLFSCPLPPSPPLSTPRDSRQPDRRTDRSTRA